MHKLYKTIENEVTNPLTGTVKGTIPLWVNGSLYRNGPGMYEIGEHKLNHWFDGMAMIQRFCISKGSATYQRRFLQSDTYVKNTTSGRIVHNTFATAAVPDPCKNIFQRFLTVFESKDVTDNTFVNVLPFNDEIYTTLDFLYMNKIDPETLERLEKVNLEEKLGVKVATAHPHMDPDGTIHNIGQMYKHGLFTVLFKVPPKKGEEGFPKGEIIYKTPSPWTMYFPYYHSFCMTENYYVFIEQPLLNNFPKLLIENQMGHAFNTSLAFYPEIKNRFRVVNKKTGIEENADSMIESDSFFYFHQINAYEDQGHIVVDISCHKNYDILDGFYLKHLTSEEYEKKFRTLSEPEARRYVIPLDLQGKKGTTHGDLVTLEHVRATCKKTGNKVFHCEPEILADIGMEFPQINYETYNGKKYRYIYGVGTQHSEDPMYTIVKIDANTKTYTQWKEDMCYPSEPVFIPEPDGDAEDDGVLIAAVNRAGEGDDKNSCFLLVLDAKSFTEMARVEFVGVERFPRDLHGVFTSEKK